MCILTEPAKVSATQILIAPDVERKRQFTVYKNSVMTDYQKNLMILPVPHPSTLKFTDLSNYTDLFEDLEKSFALHEFGMNNSYTPKLNVFDVGSYRVSVAHNVSELNDVNPDEFGPIDDFIKHVMSKYYSDNWGFIVCKLRSGSKVKYHPFGYSHQMMNNGKLFVPTRHQHNHQHGENSEESFSDWDHSIYSFNTRSDAGNCTVEDTKLHFKPQMIQNFDFGYVKYLNKYEINGVRPNKDYIFGLA
jgi:hypothetical protein